MSGENFVVPPRSWEAIEEITDNLRRAFSLQDEPAFPIIDFIERVLDNSMGALVLEVNDHAEMDGAEGYTDPNGEFIILRDDVYRAGCSGDGRARFTAGHELGHFVLHTNILLARAKPREDIRPFRLAEPQANQFSAALLMPKKFFQTNDTAELVMDRHGVSFEAARNRLNYLRTKGHLK